MSIYGDGWKLAKIQETYLGYEDHGILTFILDLDYGGIGQGAGLHSLDAPIFDNKDKYVGRRGTVYGMEMIRRVIELFGQWEKLPGKYIEALVEGGVVRGLRQTGPDGGKEFLFKELEPLATNEKVRV